MADDFVNNFGLLGQVLFKKRNEREARTKLDEALSRELAKIAASAGYDKEMVDTRERGAKERTEMGETGANARLDKQLSHAEKLAQEQRNARVDELALEYLARLGSIKTEYGERKGLAEQQAGYDTSLAQLHEDAATGRTNIGEAGADRRQGAGLKDASEREKRERSDALERLILNNMSARELQGAEANAALTRDEAQYNRGKALEELKLKAANREATARSYNALTGLLAAGEEPTDEDRSLLGLPLRGGMQPGRLPAAGAGALPASGRHFSVSKPGGTPAKPGETPRNPDNAAPQVPVQVAPKPPTADVKLDSASGIGTGLLENIRGNTWGVGPDSKNMQALVEAYLQKSNSAESPSILDALGKELGYDQRRPAIKK